MVEGASLDAMLDAAGEFRVLTLLPPSPNKSGAPRRTTRALKSLPEISPSQLCWRLRGVLILADDSATSTSAFMEKTRP